MWLSISLLVLLFNCKGFYADVLPNNGFYKSKVHSTIGIPKWMSMQEEIRPLRKQNACLVLISRLNLTHRRYKVFCASLLIIKPETTNIFNKDLSV